jgi:hypothetical protein
MQNINKKTIRRLGLQIFEGKYPTAVLDRFRSRRESKVPLYC